ncbi:MAG: response regulator [Nitrospirae bacterium]|nr:MAG: response regulator [Nitrospirota bacterium]
MGKRILAIDDEQLILKSIERALSKIGYEVITASNKEEFLSRLENSHYDLVILDLHMDGLTREEIIKKCREQIKGDVKFLVVSGSDISVDEHFIQKPFRIGELREKVRELLNGKPSVN